MYQVYVIRSSSSGKTYIGHSDDLQKRLLQHNSGASHATKGCNDWVLVYKEKYPDRSLAMKREKFLKSGNGRRVLKLKKVIRSSGSSAAG